MIANSSKNTCHIPIPTVQNHFIDIEIICCLCNGIVFEPIACSFCLRHFCTNCIKEWLRKNKSCPTKFPECSGKKMILVRPASLILGMLSNLSINCEVCKENIQYEIIARHTKEKHPTKLIPQSTLATVMKSTNFLWYCLWNMVACSSRVHIKKSLNVKYVDDQQSKQSNQMDSNQIVAGSVDEKVVTCCICWNVLWEPIGCSRCLNHFCTNCIHRIETCPLCKTTPMKRIEPLPIITRMLQKVEVYCIYKKTGCTKSFKYSEEMLKALHEDLCEFKTFQCAGCKGSFSKPELIEHEKVCGEVYVCCKECNIFVRRIAIEIHLQNKCRPIPRARYSGGRKIRSQGILLLYCM